MQHNSIDMGHIFRTCPRLQSLQLDSPSTLYLQGNWVGSSNNNKTGSSVPLLRSLYLQNACFSQPRIPASGSSAYEAPAAPQSTPTRFWRRLQLESSLQVPSLARPPTAVYPFFALGTATNRRCSGGSTKRLNDLSPCNRVLLLTSNLTPTLRQCLQKLPNVVTTQNLVTKSVNQPNKGLALHQFLCESPHLLHLKASQSFCLVERMDLFGRWMPLPDTERMPTVNQVSGWYRQLQSLHIEFHNLGPSDRQLSPTRCRVLFGYISRLCPNLRDLEIWEPENIPGLFLELAGGLCLLTSLRLLENFCIGFGKNPQILKPRDARWLTDSGHSATSKQERRHGMGSWPGAIVKERQRANNQWERISRGGASKFVPPQGVEPELLEGLSRIVGGCRVDAGPNEFQRRVRQPSSAAVIIGLQR